MNTTTITPPRRDRPWAAWGKTDGELTIISWHTTENAAKTAAEKTSNYYYFDTWGAAQTGTEFPTDPQPETETETPATSTDEPQTKFTAHTTHCECSHWYLIHADGTVEGTGCTKNPTGKRSIYAQGHDAKHASLKTREIKNGGKLVRVAK